MIDFYFFIVRPGQPQIEAVNAAAFSAQIQFSRTPEMTCFAHQIPLISEISIMDHFGDLVTKVIIKTSCALNIT